MRPPRPVSHRCRCSWGRPGGSGRVGKAAGVNKSAASPTALTRVLFERALAWQRRRAGLRLPVCLTWDFYNCCFFVSGPRAEIRLFGELAEFGAGGVCPAGVREEPSISRASHGHGPAPPAARPRTRAGEGREKGASQAFPPALFFVFAVTFTLVP